MLTSLSPFRVPNRILTITLCLATAVSIALIGIVVAFGRETQECPCNPYNAEHGKECCAPPDFFRPYGGPARFCNADKKCFCFTYFNTNLNTDPYDDDDFDIPSTYCGDKDEKLTDGAVAGVVILGVLSMGLLVATVVSCTCYDVVKTRMLMHPTARAWSTTGNPVQSSEQPTVPIQPSYVAQTEMMATKG